MDNCCKFSPDHEVGAVIDFDQDYPLIIEDFGPGISKEDLPFIFEPFYRGKRGSRQKGSGIGLSLVRSIFDLFHLRLKVESAERQGTKFLVAFPESRTYPDSPEAQEQSRQAVRGNFFSRAFEKIFRPLLFFGMILMASSCSDAKRAFTAEEAQALQVVQEWNGLLLEMVCAAVVYKAPVSARMCAYADLAAWEAGSPGHHGAASLGGHFESITTAKRGFASAGKSVPGSLHWKSS